MAKFNPLILAGLGSIINPPEPMPERKHRVTCICGHGARCSGDYECCYLDPPDTSPARGLEP